MTPLREIPLPKLTDRMTEGRLLRWLVREGAAVHRGDVVAEVQTDKAAMQVESDADGRVRRYVAEPGQTVQVGGALLQLDVGDDSDQFPPSGATPSLKVPRAAGRLGIPLANPEPGDDVFTVVESDFTRALGEGWLEIPQSVLIAEVPAERAMALVSDYNASIPEDARRLLPHEVLLAAAVHALEKAPRLNGRFDGQRLICKQRVNLGVVCEVDGRERLAVLGDAGRMPLPELSIQLASLEHAARRGLLAPGQESGDTVVAQVARGMCAFAAPVVPPAVLRIGIGEIDARGMQTLALTIDARAVVLSQVSDYVAEIKRLMSHPLGLLLS